MPRDQPIRAFPAALLLTFMVACAPGAPPAIERSAPGVILLVGDGVGVSYWSAALLREGSLAVERMPVVGLVDTRNAGSGITDSGAAATAYATGVRTRNGAIGVGPACRGWVGKALRALATGCDGRETIVEVAERRGMGTGLVATSAVTHATPAAFAAHVPDRSMQPEIATQVARSGVDVLLGGGRGFFDGTLRPDSLDLLTALCRRAACPNTAAALADYRPDGRRLIGLFAADGMPAAAARSPSLAAMTRAALSRLGPEPRGFFLMVEGSQPDWRGHDNAPLPIVTDEVVDFDRAVGVALAFARTNPRTLVVVTADHETGGLALTEAADTFAASYGTRDHTAELVPLFAAGPGAERFGGIRDNDEVGRILLDIVGR